MERTTQARAELTGTDDPVTGVTVHTPFGEMWFERTDDAVAEIASYFPGARLALDRRGIVTRYENGRAV